MSCLRILLVGGTFDNATPKASGFVHKLFLALSSSSVQITLHNGGSYDELNGLLEETKNFDVVIWMPNVSNDLPKIRNVKEIAPHTLLVNSKRNDGDKYSFQELVNRALGVKANLTIEIKKNNDTGHFNMMLFDPLGNAWYQGDNIGELANKLIDRLVFLHCCTRQQTKRSYEYAPVPFKKVNPDAEAFVKVIRRYAVVFHDLIQPAKEVTRFLGNTSAGNFRCTKGGFPSYSFGNTVYISKRNVDKETLSVDDFVPVSLSLSNKDLLYAGEYKPSVDTPVQVRLYDKLPNIHYMIHAHVYCKNADGTMAPFTERSIPCGALEEVREVMDAIDKYYPDRDQNAYRLNLLGHGCIIMGNALSDIDNIEFVARKFPETIEV